MGNAILLRSSSAPHPHSCELVDPIDRIQEWISSAGSAAIFASSSFPFKVRSIDISFESIRWDFAGDSLGFSLGFFRRVLGESWRVLKGLSNSVGNWELPVRCSTDFRLFIYFNLMLFCFRLFFVFVSGFSAFLRMELNAPEDRFIASDFNRSFISSKFMVSVNQNGGTGVCVCVCVCARGQSMDPSGLMLINSQLEKELTSCLNWQVARGRCGSAAWRCRNTCGSVRMPCSSATTIWKGAVCTPWNGTKDRTSSTLTCPRRCRPSGSSRGLGSPSTRSVNPPFRA